MPCAQAPARSRSTSLRSSKQSRHSKQAKDISDRKSQMAQVLEYLVSQQAINPAPAQQPAMVPALPLALTVEPTPLASEVAPVVSERDEAMSKEDNDAISIEASWDGDSLECPNPEVQELPEEACPSSEVPSETDIASPPSSVRALMFPDFLEEVKSPLQRPASAPSISKSTFPLASLQGAGALGLEQFPPVDSTIATLVCDITPASQPATHLPSISPVKPSTEYSCVSIQHKDSQSSVPSKISQKARQGWAFAVPGRESFNTSCALSGQLCCRVMLLPLALETAVLLPLVLETVMLLPLVLVTVVLLPLALETAVLLPLVLETVMLLPLALETAVLLPLALETAVLLPLVLQPQMNM
ncbi:UNVERIFIED_CONTAM: hypothetical protein FKN15_029390 [Acipenser sinensis]